MSVDGFWSWFWHVVPILAAIYVCWKFFGWLVLRQFGFDIVNRLGGFQQSGVHRDREPGLFGKGKRI